MTMGELFNLDGVTPYYLVSAILFCCGLLTILTRRNAIYILMGVELILNAANLNFVAFSRYGGLGIDGHIFAIFIIILAASEAAVALAIVLQIYKHYKTIDLTETNLMKR
jgi:NADH-quinone oxidoreductase subunit K